MWAPTGSPAGSLKVALMVPVADAVAVPNVTGSEYATTVTALDGIQPDPEIVTVPPTVDVVEPPPPVPNPALGAVGATLEGTGVAGSGVDGSCVVVAGTVVEVVVVVIAHGMSVMVA